MRILISSLSAFSISACATPTVVQEPTVDRAIANLSDGAGNPRAEAVFVENGGGLEVTIRAFGMVPGTNAVHIHETGSCGASDFSSAGGHWNPLGRDHGRLVSTGQHMGDMPNLIIGQQGVGLLELRIDGARIASGRTALLDDDGAAVIIHADPDDYRSQPSGAAGPRIACGVIQPASE